MMSFIGLLFGIYLIGTTNAASSRLLLLNVCGNCGINPCYGCVEGQCSWLPGCCLGDSDCNADQSCIGRRCQANTAAVECQRKFCICPMVYAPVECDGRQYSNECQAECACQQN
eukprot:UN00088